MKFLNAIDLSLSRFLNFVDNYLKYTPSFSHSYYLSDQNVDEMPVYTYLSTHLTKLLSTNFPRSSKLSTLELGCGTGRYFSSISDFTSIVGIDINPTMINYAKQISLPNNSDIFCLDTLSFFSLFPSRQFDLIYSFGVFVEHAPFSLDLLNLILLHLKPGGYLTFTVYVGGLRRSPFLNSLLTRFSRILLFLRLPISSQFFSRDCDLESILSAIPSPFSVLSSSLLPTNDQTWMNSHRLITIHHGSYL